MKICIDARIPDGVAGGVQQVIMGMAGGLSRLEGEEIYRFLVLEGQHEWLRPFVSGPCGFLEVKPPAFPSRPSKKKRALAPLVPAYGWMRTRYPGLLRVKVGIPTSDGTVEKAGVDVMHFATQAGFLTGIKSVYSPYDLQHLHLPKYFTPLERRARESVYRQLCAQAKVVISMTKWVKDDLVRQYGLPTEKIAVVPGAPILEHYPVPSQADLERMRERVGEAGSFIYYPAQTWRHKNHLKLLDALALLRGKEGLRVKLVCSGRKNEFYPEIEKRVRALGLSDQVVFLGYVTPLEVQALYRLCRMVVFPSLFEGWGLPIAEAFLAGAAVACSNVTSLPAYVGDAAVTFDANDARSIATAVRNMWEDEALRGELAARGRERVKMFTWEKSARILRAIYRQVGGRNLTEEDRARFSAEPIV